MFNLFGKKPKGQSITLKLSGLHCTACSLSIDGELEELEGVISSTTSYARQECVITYDDKLVSPLDFKKVISKLGYEVVS